MIQSGGMIGLGFLPGDAFSIVAGVSANGDVVVGQSGDFNFLSDSEALRWTQAGGMVALGFLPGHSYSLANAVSADGLVIVGGSRVNSFADNGQAFRWTRTAA